MISRLLLLVSVANYRVTVHTSRKALAGTDGEAYVTLYGDRGETDELHLDQRGQNLFESGE